MVRELYRLLRHKGYLVIFTVIKRKGAVYFYRKNNKFILDPTHVRKYRLEEEFLTLLRENGFNIEKSRTRVAKYSLLELVIRLLTKLNLLTLQRARDVYVKNRFIFKISQFLQIPICGFYEIEVSCKKA